MIANIRGAGDPIGIYDKKNIIMKLKELLIVIAVNAVIYMIFHTTMHLPISIRDNKLSPTICNTI